MEGKKRHLRKALMYTGGIFLLLVSIVITGLLLRCNFFEKDLYKDASVNQTLFYRQIESLTLNWEKIKTVRQESQGSSMKGLLTYGNATVLAEVADTDEKRQRGLSGRETLQDGEGMLFLFEVSGQHKFWMNNMKIALDIVWIADDGEIAHIEENVTPETFPQVFSSKIPTRAVLEVPAGWVERNGVIVGEYIQGNVE